MTLHLPLAEALRLGRNLTHPGTSTHQTRPMLLALKGAGKLPMNLDDRFAFEMDHHFNPYQAVAYPEDCLLKTFPWLIDPVLCPWCTALVHGGEIVEHPSEEHGEEIGENDEYEWIADMELVPEMRTRALAVYFRNSYERLHVLEMAKAQKMSSTHFLAAAARLVVQYHIPLRSFVRMEESEW